MKVSIKSIIDGNKEVIILTYVDEFISSPEEKLSLEKKLKDYVFLELLPKQSINVYRSFENDVASITVIKSLNSFENQREIDL